MSGAWRRRLRNGAIAALALIVCVALLVGESAEIVQVRTGSECRIEDEKTGLRGYEPGCSGRRDIGDGPVRFSINNRGFRGDAPRPGTRRVLLLGGTLTFGPGIPDAKELSVVTEGYLERSLREGVDVLNLSVEGYSTTHHAIRLEEYIRRFVPELIVLSTFTRRGMYRDHLVDVQRGSKGYPLQLLGPPGAWRHFKTSWKLKKGDAASFAGASLDAIKQMHRVCRNQGIKFRVAWDGYGTDNARIGGGELSDSPLRLVTPKVRVSAEELEWMLSEKEMPLHYANDWHAHPEVEPELFAPGGHFYNAQGIDRLAYGLARLVDNQLF